jgi:hypothetical protein
MVSLREKEDDFHSPPPSLTWWKERYDPFDFQSFFSFWTSQVSDMVSLREKEDDFRSPPSST